MKNGAKRGTLDRAANGTIPMDMTRAKARNVSLLTRRANLTIVTESTEIDVPTPWPNAAVSDLSNIGEKTMIVTAVNITAWGPFGHAVTIQNKTMAPTPMNTRKALMSAGR